MGDGDARCFDRNAGVGDGRALVVAVPGSPKSGDDEALADGVDPDVSRFDRLTAANTALAAPDGGTRRSLEVRWVFSGPLPATVIDWLGPFPAAIEERNDCYLVSPRIPGVSLKTRDATILDVKVAQGGAGVVGLQHGSRGRLQSWEKLTFPLVAGALPMIDGSRWVAVTKVRRRRLFTTVAGQPVELPLSDIEGPGCTAELTEVHVGGEVGWTVALEARGPSAVIRDHVRAAAACLFREHPPPGVKLGLRDSMSYLRWLHTPEIRRHASDFSRLEPATVAMGGGGPAFAAFGERTG